MDEEVTEIELRDVSARTDTSRFHHWVATDNYRMLSLAFTVHSTDATFAEALRWHLAPFHRGATEQHSFSVGMVGQDDDDGGPPSYRFYVGREVTFEHRQLVDVLNHAIWELQAMVGRYVQDFVMLHAGAVVLDGMAAVFPARMNSGKSSLVMAMLQAGSAYLSDEIGAIDPLTGRAYPFPKRVTLDRTAIRLFPGLSGRLVDRPMLTRRLLQGFVRPEEVGASIAGPAPVRWIVFPRPVFDGPPRLQPVAKSKAVRMMAENGFNLYRYGERGVVLLSRLSSEAEAFTLEGGTPSERAALLVERLADA
jgi:hypothetical protein